MTTDISKVNYISKATFDQKTQVDSELDFVNIGGSISLPSDTYVDLTPGASTTQYTAPADGYYFIRRISTGSGQHIAVKQVAWGAYPWQVFSSSSNQYWTLFVPVKKGDVIQVDYAMPTSEYFRFIYAVGSEWEA